MNISIMLIKRDPSLPNPVNLIPLSLRTSCLKWRSLCFGHLRKAKSPTCHKAPFAGLVDVIESKLCDVSPSRKDWSRTPVGPGSSTAFAVMLVLRLRVYHSPSVSSEPLSTSVKREWCLVWRVARIPREGAQVYPWQEVRGANLARLLCGSRSAVHALRQLCWHCRLFGCHAAPSDNTAPWTREPGAVRTWQHWQQWCVIPLANCDAVSLRPRPVFFADKATTSQILAFQCSFSHHQLAGGFSDSVL